MKAIATVRKNRDLWLVRLYYFIYFGGGGLALPFLPLFYSRLDFSGKQIGWVTAVVSMVALVAAPVWTDQSSRWRYPRTMLQGALLTGSLCYLWLSQQNAFWGVVLITVFRTLILAGVWPLSDSMVLAIIRGQGRGFGTVRVWTSAGWVASGLFGGWLMEQTSVRSTIMLAGASALLAALVVFALDARYFQISEARTPAGVSLRSVVRGLLRDRAMVGLALMISIIGMMNNGIVQFEAIYLETLGASDSLIGVAVILSAVVEIPVMLLTDRIMARHGAYRLLLVAMLLNACTRLMVFIMPSVPTIMLERAIGGISFSFYVLGLFTLISQRAVPQQMRTVMALYNVTLASIIGIVAPPLAGAIYDWVGARWLYLIAAAGYVLAGWVLWRVTGPARMVAALVPREGS